ncbi:MAG: (d)CMP kinase [Pseudomonadota bacterium]
MPKVERHGKGTIARAIAMAFNFGHLDSGMLYRAVGAQTLSGVDPITAARSLSQDWLASDSLRTPEVSQAASKVAVIADVRAALLDYQRAFARRAGGSVIDGRDIGTVICPESDLKLFVTASADVRAKRRFQELIAAGHDVTLQTVLTDVLTRDARDRDRTDSPLVAAKDAIVFDTSTLSIDQAVHQAIELVAQRLRDRQASQ